MMSAICLPAAARQTNMNASLAAVSDVTGLAAVSPESPYYKMDYASSLLPEQQKWNEFVGGFGQAMEDWRQNNGGKIPSVMQEREIAQQILFPQGAPAQLRVETGAGSGEAQDPFSLWVEQLLNDNGIALTDDAIGATKERLKRLNPNIEKEYQNMKLNIKTEKAGG
jgi:hypothetical protein